jgi:hypothetical protein
MTDKSRCVESARMRARHAEEDQNVKQCVRLSVKATQTASIRKKTVKGLHNDLPYPILPRGLQ